MDLTKRRMRRRSDNVKCLDEVPNGAVRTGTTQDFEVVDTTGFVNG